MTGIYLLLGSNLGDRELYLTVAKKQLEQSIGAIETMSSLYQTEAWGMGQAPAFLNQVLLINSDQQPQQILQESLKIESGLGRIRQQSYVDRTIDIDILYHGDLVLNEPDLVIPHPRISQRRFVLTPLTEIAPEFVHPVLKKTNSQLLEQCQDLSTVISYKL